MAVLNTDLGKFTVKIEFDEDAEEVIRQIVREEIAAAAAEPVNVTTHFYNPIKT